MISPFNTTDAQTRPYYALHVTSSMNAVLEKNSVGVDTTQ